MSKIRIDATVDEEIADRAKEYAKKKGLTMSALIRVALTDYIDAQEKMPALLDDWMRQLEEVQKKIK